MVAALSRIDDINSQDNNVWTPIFVVFVCDGIDITLHVRRRHLKDPSMGRMYPLPTKHDIILQPPNNMAQGSLLSTPLLPPSPLFFPVFQFPSRPLKLTTVTPPLALLPSLGNDRYN